MHTARSENYFTTANCYHIKSALSKVHALYSLTAAVSLLLKVLYNCLPICMCYNYCTVQCTLYCTYHVVLLFAAAVSEMALLLLFSQLIGRPPASPLCHPL